MGAVEQALERFKSKCIFDPTTGCVLWQGALTNGKGSSSIYGRFWFQGKSWYAHLWAAKYIHGLDINEEGTQCDHNCKPMPNSLCVQHLQIIPELINRKLRWSRFWDYWADNYEEGSEAEPTITGDLPEFAPVPFYEPPAWLGLVTTKGNKDDCPF